MLLMPQIMEEILISRDTTIFRLQHPSFILNLQKFILKPLQDIEFPFLTVNFVNLTILSSQQKPHKIQDQ